MSTTVSINSSGWRITTFFGGELGRSYQISIPGKGRKICTEEEFLAFFESIPNRIESSSPAQVVLSVPGHSLPDVAFKTKEDAQKVLDQLRRILSISTSATVGDFLRMIDEPPTFKDDRWGWVDLTNVEISESLSGDEKEGTLYRLDLPAANVLF